MQPANPLPGYGPLEDGLCPRCGARHHPGYSCPDPAAEGERAARADVRSAQEREAARAAGELACAEATAAHLATTFRAFVRHRAVEEGPLPSAPVAPPQRCEGMCAEGLSLRCGLQAGHPGRCIPARSEHVEPPPRSEPGGDHTPAVAQQCVPSSSAASSSGPREAPNSEGVLSSLPHPSSGAHPTELERAQAAAHRIAWAACCFYPDHERQLEKVGIAPGTKLCLLCALRAVTTDEGGTVHEHAEAIEAWALDFGAADRETADMLASLAVNAPGLFLKRWHSEQPWFFGNELKLRETSARASVHPVGARQLLELALCDLRRLIHGAATERDRQLPEVRRTVREALEWLEG